MSFQVSARTIPVVETASGIQTPTLVAGPRLVERPLATPITTAPSLGLLASLEIEAEGLKDTRKWKDLLSRIKAEDDRYTQCDGPGNNCSAKLTDWRNTIEKLRDADPFDQLYEINSYANGLARFVNDIVSYGHRDHWATPLEFLSGLADCEDYAIFKFASLLELGFSRDQVRLVIAKDELRELYHAVVSVNLDGRVYILDSLNADVMTDDQLLKYRPLRSHTLDKSYLHIVTDETRRQYIAKVMTKPKLPLQLVREAEADLRPLRSITWTEAEHEFSDGH